ICTSRSNRGYAERQIKARRSERLRVRVAVRVVRVKHVLVKHDETWQHRPSIQIEFTRPFRDVDLGGTSYCTNSTVLDDQRLVLSGGRARAIDDSDVSQCDA